MYVLAVNNKTTNFKGFDKQTHISEAFRIDFVHISTLLRSSAKPPIFSIGGRFDQTSFHMRRVIVPPSRLIVKMFSPPRRGVFSLGGVSY